MINYFNLLCGIARRWRRGNLFFFSGLLRANALPMTVCFLCFKIKGATNS
jgi:hypothetical protein